MHGFLLLISPPPNGIVSLLFFLPFLSLLWFHVYFHRIARSYVFCCCCCCCRCSVFLFLLLLLFCRVWNFAQCAAIVRNSFIPFEHINRFVTTSTRIWWRDKWMELHNYAKKNEEWHLSHHHHYKWADINMSAIYAFRLAIRYPFVQIYLFISRHKQKCKNKNTKPSNPLGLSICIEKLQRRNTSKRSIGRA